MPQVAVAVFDIHERKACLLRSNRSFNKAFDDVPNFHIGKAVVTRADAKLSVKQWMMIKDARLKPGMFIGSGEASGVGELQPHQ